jgi:hypothetical protein
MRTPTGSRRSNAKQGGGCLDTRPCFTPYWTTFELPTIDMKASSVGTLDQIVVRLR